MLCEGSALILAGG